MLLLRADRHYAALSAVLDWALGSHYDAQGKKVIRIFQTVLCRFNALAMEEGLKVPPPQIFVSLQVKVKCFYRSCAYTYHSANSIASGRGQGMVGVSCVHPAVTGKKRYSQGEEGKAAIPRSERAHSTKGL